MLRKAFQTLVVIAFCSVVYSCQKEDLTDTKNESSTPPPATTGSFNVNSTLLLQLVNNVRKSGCNCGATVMPPVPAVSWNDQLATAALNHSRDMNANNYFSHTSLSGSTAGDRIRLAGYNWRTYGENIAKGYLNEQSVMDGWLKSEGHCKNIMGANFKEMGVAREANYWSQEFGAK